MTDEKIRAIFKASVGGICGSSAITFARAILAAEAPDTVRVPREPTPEMLIRGGEAVFYALGPGEAMRSEQDQDDAASIYRAMLAAAPKDTP